MPPTPVAVRAVALFGDIHRAHLVVGEVIEGNPIEPRARWHDAVTADLAAAAMVALVAAAPLVGAALVGVSSAAP